jgi:hypothetical protein
MSEEAENKGGFFSNIKNQIATGAGVILTGIGTMFMDEVKSFIGIDDEPQAIEQPAVEQKQEVNVSGPEIIINIPEQKPAETKTIIKEVPAKPVEKPKEKEQEVDW